MILSPRYHLIDVYITYSFRLFDLACLVFYKIYAKSPSAIFLLLLASLACFLLAYGACALTPSYLLIVVYIAYIYRVLDCFLLIVVYRDYISRVVDCFLLIKKSPSHSNIYIYMCLLASLSALFPCLYSL